MEPCPLNIVVNLDALLGELQRSLQWTINLVSVALKVQVSPDDNSQLRLPLGTFATTFDQRLLWTPTEAMEHHRNWILSNGFRDAIEGLSLFVESAHEVLSYWKLAEQQQGGIQLRGEDWNREIVSGEKSFHRLGLPDKFTHLQREHAVSPEATLLRQILSVNSARNCLVHRNGVVTEKDITNEASLNVEWRKLVTLLKDEDGEHDLVLGRVIEKDSWLCIKGVDHCTSFRLGERITFTTQEFADVTWGLFLFGSDLVQKISTVGLSKGFIKERDQPAPESVQPGGPRAN
ncbi:hypothetical protein SKTS_08500 [Sulfurimicrobium lacus]|uniref:Uncharacterized protein n=1 Tax=Sulfurimicrobium lacus TaxID=2715678 RepID=A0A6F8V8H8_9PROT|nr:hypothetical protein [Sulfurimicrobium lacus]BCB25964.1 hypothetical protein SKTS_08500 [Sulfurimicrobium lacus]